MHTVFSIIETISIIQCVVVIVLLLYAYGLKHYLQQQSRYRITVSRHMLRNLAEPCTPKLIRFYKKHVTVLLSLIQQSEVSIPLDYLIDTVIIPSARRFAASRNWEKRYLSCKLFDVAIKKNPKLPLTDEALIDQLIRDPVPIISIQAGIIAVHYHSQTLIDSVIDVFSSGRRIQQSLYTQLMAHANPGLIACITQRLHRELDPYTKAFCYRMLRAMPSSDSPIQGCMDDLHANHLELQLAVMHYLSHPRFTATALFLTCLHDPAWEIRAKAVKLLGKTGDKAYVKSLAGCLNDASWWVRMNAARALIALGEVGVKALNQHDGATHD